MNAADFCLSRFATDVVAASENELRSDITLGGKLQLGREGRLEVCYAPFEHVCEGARVVLLGTTPGRQQAANALLEVRRQILDGADHATALSAAKSFASFSGPMRSNLVTMRDFIGLNSWLGQQSSASLWLGDNDLVHFTSALRFPVFVDERNYSGQPSMTATPLLMKFLVECLTEEARVLGHAVWVPLGAQATLAADWLVERGCLESRMVLRGLPHPSGANAERIAYFLGRKPRELLSHKTNASTLDAVRSQLRAQVATLPHQRVCVVNSPQAECRSSSRSPAATRLREASTAFEEDRAD
jgi:hypothetical protein